MDWRLQGAGIAGGAVLSALPLFLGAPPYSGPGGTAISAAAFAASWSNTASVMIYPLVASLPLAALGIVWQGPIRRKSAWIIASASFLLGCFSLFSLASVAFASFDYRGGDGATVPAQNLLTIGLAVPTLGFFSAVIWLFRDGRRNPNPVKIPQVWNTANDGNGTTQG